MWVCGAYIVVNGLYGDAGVRQPSVEVDQAKTTPGALLQRPKTDMEAPKEQKMEDSNTYGPQEFPRSACGIFYIYETI